MSIDERKEGTVARLFPDRVFGFIHCPTEDRDYFFHQAQLENCPFSKLQPGDAVSFLVGTGPNGKIEAQEVRRLDYEPKDGRETRAQVGLPAKPKLSRYRRR